MEPDEAGAVGVALVPAGGLDAPAGEGVGAGVAGAAVLSPLADGSELFASDGGFILSE